jgi:hypothetical protein
MKLKGGAMENKEELKKVSTGLKIAAVIMLIESLVIFISVILGKVRASGGLQDFLTVIKIIFLLIAVTEFFIALGILKSRKIAVYGAIILSSILLIGNLSQTVFTPAGIGISFIPLLWVIFRTIVIFLARTCLIQNRT